MTPRPAFHITPPQHWMNDPTGPLHWQGRYHLFFQYNPDQPAWGPPRWGHVSSPDVATWQRHPVALEPSADGPDRDGCWSGCTRVEDGVPTIYYTGVVGHTDADRVESVLRATSDDLIHWRKDPEPVVAGPPPDADTGFHRDPFTFTANEQQHLILGSSVLTPAGPTGAVLRYTRADDGTWQYQGVLFDGSGSWPIDTGPLWEVPQLIRLDDTDVLIVSVQDPAYERPLRYAIAFLGQLVNGRFQAHAVQRLDRGDLLYAPTTLVHDDRVLLWGWIQDPQPHLGPANPDRCVGAISLPREVRLRDGELTLELPPQIDRIREQQAHQRDLVEISGEPHVLSGIPNHAEIAFDITEHHGAVAMDLGPQWDGTTGSITLANERDVATVKDPVHVRVLVDADIVEVFTSDGLPHTMRLHHTSDAPLRLDADGPGRVEALTVYSLRPTVT